LKQAPPASERNDKGPDTGPDPEPVPEPDTAPDPEARQPSWLPYTATPSPLASCEAAITNEPVAVAEAEAGAVAGAEAGARAGA